MGSSLSWLCCFSRSSSSSFHPFASPSNMSSYPQLYRNTTVGVTLQETLDEMIAVGARRSDQEQRDGCSFLARDTERTSSRKDSRSIRSIDQRSLDQTRSKEDELLGMSMSLCPTLFESLDLSSRANWIPIVFVTVYGHLWWKISAWKTPQVNTATSMPVTPFPKLTKWRSSPAMEKLRAKVSETLIPPLQQRLFVS